MAEVSTGKPYVQKLISENSFERTFEENVIDNELIWHRDKKHRNISVISCGEGWKFQYENCLPFNLYDGIKFKIEKETFHRVIKGEGNLRINIEEHD